MNEIIEVLRGPWGLLAQLLALGYVLSGLALYGLRRRFFHPDMINVLGAGVGGVAWTVIQILSIAGSGEYVNAVAPLGTVLALPTVSATIGRAYWLFVAHRDEDRRDSMTKWQYKTHATALAFGAVALGAGLFVAPAQTLLVIVVVGAAFLSWRSDWELFDRIHLISRHRSNTPKGARAIRRSRRARRGRIELDLGTLERARAAAAGVAGSDAVHDPIVELAARGGWRALIVVSAAEVKATAPRRLVVAAARAAAEAAPELAEVVVRIEGS